MINFQKTSLDHLKVIRLDYLKTLPVFQDYFIEMQVQISDCLGLYNDNLLIGFITKSSDDILTELYVPDSFLNQLNFREILNQAGIKSVYCQSFDHLLMNLCMRNNFPYQMVGCLYRDWCKVNIMPLNGVASRLADSEDLAFLIQQDDDVFEPKELLSGAIQKKEIILFLKETEIIGCGFRTRIHPQFEYFDMGVWVHPSFRNRGYATYIMVWLKESCIQNNWIPICGCDINNLASQHTLAKAGFISKYSILEFAVTPI